MQEIKSLYEAKFDQQVRTMARKLGGDIFTAEDVVQEAYCRAYRFYPSYDPQRGPLGPWFNSILYNALRDEQRAARGAPEEFNEMKVEDVLTPQWRSEFGVYLANTVSVVRNIKHRRVLELFVLLGYTSKEVSQIERDMTQTNVTTIVERFKEGLMP